MKDESFVSLYHLHMCFRSLNAGRTALLTDSREDRAVQERSSEVIFGTVYSHRASTIPGSLQFSPALTLFVCAVLIFQPHYYTRRRESSQCTISAFQMYFLSVRMFLPSRYSYLTSSTLFFAMKIPSPPISRSAALRVTSGSSFLSGS